MPKLLPVVLITLLLSALPSHGNEKNVLRVGVENMDYYPVMDFTTDNHRGLFSDILYQFAEANDVALDFIPLPLQRFNFWFQEYAIDLRLPDNPRWTRSTSPSLIYSEPLITVCDTTLVLAENKHIAKQDIQIVGMLSGFTPAEKWQSKLDDGSLELAYEGSVRMLTRMLLAGMVDAIDLQIATVEEQLKSLGLPTDLVVTAESVPASGVRYTLSTKSHPSVIAALNYYIKENRHAIDALAQRYGVAVNQACD